MKKIKEYQVDEEMQLFALIKNGVAVRMAILKLLIEGGKK